MTTLKDLRINHDFTQDELANLFGVVPATIAKVEKDSNRVRIGLLKKYELAFGVKLDDIFLGNKCRLSALYETRKNQVLQRVAESNDTWEEVI